MSEENDHRRLGRSLGLFHFVEEAPGAAFWLPPGLAVVRALEAHVRAVVAADGYEEVRTPQILARSLWEQSGHWEKFSEAMMAVGEDRAAALKPVSCPGAIQVVRQRLSPKRARPRIERIAELGMVMRDERRSQLHGLFRLRQFTQDDGHVFCGEGDIDEEVARFVARAEAVYARCGLPKPEAVLSLRPAVRAGDDDLWDRAESALARAVRAAGLEVEIAAGGGAFYGPKLELVLRDGRGRPWQCGTIQLDFVLPGRFDLPYVMLHRAMLGSFERFLGLLLERRAGHLPTWLAPSQARVVPVARSNGLAPYVAEVLELLRARGVRVSSDDRDVPLGARVRRAHDDRVPIVIVVGPRDRDGRRLSLRMGTERSDRALPDAIDVVAGAASVPGP